MLPDATLVQQAIQLLYEKEQETMRLIKLVQHQNQALLVLNQHQQELVAQKQYIIDRLEAELRTYRLAQQASFGQVHFN